MKISVNNGFRIRYNISFIKINHKFMVKNHLTLQILIITVSSYEYLIKLLIK